MVISVLAVINPEIWVPAVTGVGGAILLKLFEWIAKRSGTKANLAKELRDELRNEALSLRSELRELERELSRWRTKYYEIIQILTAAKYVLLEHSLIDEVQTIQHLLDQLDAPTQDLDQDKIDRHAGK